jgi:hypothetical protein
MNECMRRLWIAAEVIEFFPFPIRLIRVIRGQLPSLPEKACERERLWFQKRPKALVHAAHGNSTTKGTNKHEFSKAK